MKSKFIEVYDNILPSIIEDRIYQISLNIPYSYKRDIIFGSENDNFFPGFNLNLYDDVMGLIDFKFYPIFSQILHYFCSSQKILLDYIHRCRVIFSLPHIDNDQSLGIHTDLKTIEGETIPHWVCLYYVNDSDGDTIFFDNNNNEIKRVSPKKGRIVFFDGSVNHVGSYPTKNERIGVNINFKGTLCK